MSIKLVKTVLCSVLIFSAQLQANPASEAACSTATHGGSSITQVISATVTTIYNVFPIRIGGVNFDFFPGTEDLDSVSSIPACVCLTPVPRPGIKISLWEPIAVVEPTAIPYCSPTIGTSIPVSIGSGAASFGQNNSDNTKHTNTYQAHYIRYPVFKALGILMDFVCVDATAGTDYLYITELDPMWQNDIWAAIIGPEAFLVANPIAEMACMADSVTANAGFPLDPLWWCLGSWNGTFPMSQTTKGTTAIQAQGSITARMLMKLHRQLMLWGSIGDAGLCQQFPMPIMRKSQYSIFPIYPFVWPFRIPIGRSGMIWESGHENPANQHSGVWAVYRKRDCCAI